MNKYNESNKGFDLGNKLHIWHFGQHWRLTNFVSHPITLVGLESPMVDFKLFLGPHCSVRWV